jgi:hypothetical protein
VKGLPEIKRRILFTLLAGYLLFDYAFMQVRIPPSGMGIPLGEIFLLFALVTTNLPLALTRMSAAVYLLPVLVWWAYGLGRAVADSFHYGFWALRDANQVIESLYLIVGFCVAAQPGFIERLVRWLPLVLAIACVYGLGFPFQDRIQAMSPTLFGADRVVPFFGNYLITGAVMLWMAFYCLIAPTDNPFLSRLCVPVAGLLIAFVVLIFQARTTYLQLLGLGTLLLVFRRFALVRLISTIPIVILALALIVALDLHITGRLTDKITFSFFFEHVEAIFGIGVNQGGAIGGAAQGIDLRLGWWKHIYAQLTGDAGTLLTGLGYGIPLTNFRDNFNDIVREPHNSYISVVARLGILGFGAWAWMQIELFRNWLCAYRACHRSRWRDGETLLLMIMAFGVLVLIDCIGEDGLEKPFYAIPFYCLWGVALRMVYAVRAKETRPVVVAKRQPGFARKRLRRFSPSCEN